MSIQDAMDGSAGIAVGRDSEPVEDHDLEAMDMTTIRRRWHHRACAL